MDAMRMEVFESKLQRAMERVRLVLHAAKAPVFAANAHHQYQDKYFLAECITNTAVASQINCLTALGLSAEHVSKLREWAKASTVSFRFRSEENCVFDREETREIESPTKRIEEVSSAESTVTLTSKVVTTKTEYFWKFSVSYELLAIRGVGEHSEDRMTLKSRRGEDTLKTTTKASPRKEAKVPAFEADTLVSWLFECLEGPEASPSFKIDRAGLKCHTPRRNLDINAAGEQFARLLDWTAKVNGYLTALFQGVKESAPALDLTAMNSSKVFVPVLPLLEDPDDSGESRRADLEDLGPAIDLLASLPPGMVDPGSALLGVEDTNRLLAEEARSLREQLQNLGETFAAAGDTAVATAAEGALALTLQHSRDVCRQWDDSIEYIEGMLRKQLIAAIGKEIKPADFGEYMQFHNRKLFLEAYAPAPFCFAVRRSEQHSPEGTLSIEQQVRGGGGDTNIASPIVTLCARGTQRHTMHFPLSASTDITFDGDRHLHAWLSHQFSGQTGVQLSLVSRARQFSSFLVLVGRISSATAFDPKYAAIVQNKDELTIPLDLSTLPTPKEFKDAIESLSPEQQAFAKAFRAMQLESTLFGVLVIQIKPQLERVLNLPDDSLTKEIKLTQDLMQLFIKYQIPSDLLSFDGNDPATGSELVGATLGEALAAVKGHVTAMNDMIKQSQDEEISGRRLEAAYANPVAGGDWGCQGGGGDLLGGFEVSRSSMMRSKGVARSMAPMPEAMYAAAPLPPAAPMMAAASPPPPPCPVMMAAPAASAVPAPMPPASAAPVPAAAQAQPTQPQTQQQQPQPEADDASLAGRDYTQVPQEMDRRFDALDVDHSLRPTIISPSGSWTKRAQKALLANPTVSNLSSSDQKKEKDAAFDLLDALTKSGALPIEHASLHVVVAATHCFDKTVTETVVQDNINPVDKVERSTLIMATTVHQQSATALIRTSQRERIQAVSPMLFLEDS